MKKKIQIGDIVEHKKFGQGIVEQISKSPKTKLPVKVYFQNRKTYSYFTMDGKSHINAVSSKMRHW